MTARPSANYVLLLGLLGLLCHGPTLSFAVDRTKFRTCAQTSFCRRHRNGHSESLYKYKLTEWKFHEHPDGSADEQGGGAAASGGKEEGEIGADGSEPDADAGDGSAAAAASGGGIWNSVVSRVLGSGSKKSDGPLDPYVRGPTASLTATLVNTSPTTSTGDGESLNLEVRLHSDGVARVRVTERYGTAGTKYESARWTSDELILNEKEMVGAADAEVLTASANGDVLSELVGKVFTPSPDQSQADMDNYVGLRYGNADHVLLLRMEPFSFYLFRRSGDASSFGTPIVAVGERGLAHFEIRRAKEGDEAGAAAGEDGANSDAVLMDDDDYIPPDEDEEGGEEENKAADEPEDKHGGKEIVGYWEDGLAIYADGTREERPVQDEAEVEHRKLLEEQSPDLDREGLWEESFGGHTDSKPYGPMSVGMDIKFPGSSHIFGLPEHASSTVLQTTHGPEAKYHEPFRLYNLDVFEYELDETMALYGEIPVIISQSLSGGTAGIFWFNPTETFVDVYSPNDNGGISDAAGHGTTTHFMSESGIMDLFLLPGPDPHSLYEQYGRLTGRVSLPPMFSLGYHQCRWNYRDEPDVYAVHAKFEELDYPYDVLWLDIEHTDGKRYFTWDHNTFPNPVDMIKKLDSQGRRMVTIIDPHIKRDNNYYIHKEATAKGLYIKDKSGKKDFDGWCWPGSSSYLDFTADKVRSWWADQFAYDRYKGSTPALFTWNDMNEPSVFNGPEVSMQKDLRNLAGVEHREWHNLYGLLFQRATASGLIRRNPDKNIRPFVLSRSFFAGSQRYGAIWTGDNAAEWSHLEAAAPMLLSLNVGALSFVGADVGGFFGDPDAELMTRWMQAGAYTPFFRGHAHHDSKRREPWMFGDETMIRLRKAAMARYALLPFWYTIFREASVSGMPVMRTMWMEYPRTEALFATDDQYLVGSDLLVKPVTGAGVTQSTVLFPTADAWYDVDTMERVAAEGQKDGVLSITVDSDIDKIPVYQRGGSIIPRKLRLRRSARLMKADPYTLYVALDGSGKAQGSLYMDDEETFAHEVSAAYGLSALSIDLQNNSGTMKNEVEVGAAWKDDSTWQALVGGRSIERIIIMGLSRSPKKIKADSTDSVQFEFDAATKILIIKQPGVSALTNWSLGFEF